MAVLTAAVLLLHRLLRILIPRRNGPDVQILPSQLCGTGVAMKNAIPQVKEVADYETLSNNEDGVAKYIEENIL